MAHYQTTRTLPYTQKFMYALVADVAHYPDFLPWCHKLSIMTQDAQTMTTEMHIQKGGFGECVHTMITLDPPHKIAIALAPEAPKKSLISVLDGVWTFAACPDNAMHTCVHFDITVKLDSMLFNALLGQVFSGIALDMVDAFEERARVMSQSYQP